MRFVKVLVIFATGAVGQSIDPELAEHTALFEKKIYHAAPNVYSAVGYSLGNSIMIEGDSGIIVVDTLSSVEAARQVREEFRKITPKPVAAVIVTHFHPDHVHGIRAFLDSPGVEIYAQESLM